MKLYLFYRIMNPNGDKIKRGILYAITDDKNLSKLFEETRSKDVFVKKVHECKRKEALELLDKNKNSIITLSVLHDFDGSEYEIPCTWREEKSVLIHQQNTLMDEMFFNLVNPDIFNEETKKLLKSIDYDKFWEAKVLRRHEFFVDFFNIDLKIDEFLLFIKVYGWMLNDK